MDLVSNLFIHVSSDTRTLSQPINHLFLYFLTAWVPSWGYTLSREQGFPLEVGKGLVLSNLVVVLKISTHGKWSYSHCSNIESLRLDTIILNTIVWNPFTLYTMDFYNSLSVGFFTCKSWNSIDLFGCLFITASVERPVGCISKIEDLNAPKQVSKFLVDGYAGNFYRGSVRLISMRDM